MIRATSRLAARFKNNSAADRAHQAVNDTLATAQKEVAALFAQQGGVADASDVAAIYVKYGFRNDCGWQQDTPIWVEEATLYWEIPDGMHLDEAEQLLLAFGAISIKQESAFEDDLMRIVPHPAALFLSELEDMPDFDDDEPSCFESCDKKTIH